MTESKAAAPIGTSTLPDLARRVPTPGYDRAALSCGIAHMSVGGFHRAHQAVYLDDLMAREPGDWLIAGIGLLDSDAGNVAAMKAQDGLYCALERSADEDKARVIGTIKEMHHATPDPAAVLRRLEDPAIRILSLTVTEKGYCADKRGELDEANPAVQNDLKNPRAPRTAMGYAVAALKARKEQGAKPFTIMSCDNLSGNGHVAHRIFTSFAKLVDKDLASWIDDHVTFPNAMVDRITPITTSVVQDVLREKFGVEDRWPVVCEDYRQWVLEDSFCQGRPALEQVGVQIVKDVEPFEHMKVRLLNGAHSALAYLSYLMGFRDVDRAMADPAIGRYTRVYMDSDVTPSVPAVPDTDLGAYKDTLIRRFANPAVRDQVLRLTEDGSAKFRNSIVPPLEYQLEHDGSIRFIALALAGWIRFVTAEDEDGKPITVKDPMAAILKERAGRDPAPILGMQEIFGAKVAASERVRAEVGAALASLYEKGARRTVEDYLATQG